ncbi:hypothetical protein PGT21_024502 [Puccinia graminis f. sp. tritici]|uniref:Uncharacterized protein n=2 Tax=Puccinia graminis f. sp. tritici TaxID=56615 RepID=A0A5B0PU80_PUCGR|nr:hypothetical protein PGTUg99_023763 [Puccinia graminis f. sp. tritici]KAA1104466.1 hypothetical protein PGT21_024502 [Puccinia graminis f. sp. tritici]
MASSATLEPSPTSAPPLDGVGNKAPSKSRKRRRVEPEDDHNPRYPQPLEELMKMTAVELRKIAQENSKEAFSVDDEKFFLDFYHQQEVMLAIKAIERQVSLPMIHTLLGRRVAIREANRWNRFLQTPEARAIFQANGRGVKNKQVMALLSVAYGKLTEAEKEALTAPPVAATNQVSDITIEQAVPTGDSQPRRGDEDLTPSELALDDESEDDSGHRALGSGGGQAPQAFLHGTVSNLVRKDQAEKAINKWSAESLNIAKTCNCEVVIFAVSKHLSAHSFKFERCTPGAIKEHTTILEMDGDNHYSARLQALLTGNSVGQITVANKLPGNQKKKLRNLLPQLTAQLAVHINRKTHGVLTSWPWTDNNKRLAEAKYRLELSHLAVSDINWLRRSNKKLKKTHVSMLLLDLDRGYIKVVPVLPTPTASNTELQHNIQGSAQTDQTSSSQSPPPDNTRLNLNQTDSDSENDDQDEEESNGCDDSTNE